MNSQKQKKILIVTEEPNSTASSLRNANDLFCITKNPFCQFPARLFFGLEIHRNFFNGKFFVWKHANGSYIYGGNKNQDGDENIKVILNQQEFLLLVLFGKKALKPIIGKEVNSLSQYLTNNPVTLDQFLKNHGVNNSQFSANKHTPIAVFPHPSGQAANAWMKNTSVVCDCLTEVQKISWQMIVNYLS